MIWSPTFLVPGPSFTEDKTSFMEENFSMGRDGGWSWDDSCTLNLLCPHWSDGRWGSAGNGAVVNTTKLHWLTRSSPPAVWPSSNKSQASASLWPWGWGPLTWYTPHERKSLGLEEEADYFCLGTAGWGREMICLRPVLFNIFAHKYLSGYWLLFYITKPLLELKEQKH